MLGKQALGVKVMNSYQLNNTDVFEANAHHLRNEIKVTGVGNLFAEMNPYPQPCVDRSLIGKQFFVCIVYDMDEGGNYLRWYRGGGAYSCFKLL